MQFFVLHISDGALMGAWVLSWPYPDADGIVALPTNIKTKSLTEAYRCQLFFSDLTSQESNARLGKRRVC